MQVGRACLRVEPGELITRLDHQPARVHQQRRLTNNSAGLLELADSTFFRRHVIPLAVGEHVGLGGGFVLAELSDGDRVLYLENAARGHVVEDPEMVNLIDRKWDGLLGEALSTGASVDLVRKLKVTP
ncbi:Scr1 family TA system antitoxin-like transcriptional regulator [Micromonospora citrea]|uniref:Scr1 family TA system antitoxin-like transcriptional regulator n=1 Tax=Micromonospora citrea TaxID=47855 RepID=UPI003C45D6D1